MEKLLTLAWRNIWRNKRRSLITISAIAFAILIVATTRSMQYGTYDTMEYMAVSLYNGEVQVHRNGFQHERSVDYFLAQDEKDWQAIIETYPQYTAFSRRLTSFGLVSSDSASTGALIVGIEPEREPKITQFSGMVKEGESLKSGDDHLVLVGATLAKNLAVGIGDTLVVLTQGYRNQMGADLYVVKGTISVGHSDLDRGLMIMPLHNAQELYSLYNGITEVVLRTTNFRNANLASKALLMDFNDPRYEVLSWEEMMPELKQLIALDNISGVFYLIFILIIVGIEIFNTTMMSVVERTREFAILQSIGMKPKQIGGLIFTESFLKIAISLTVGFLLSYLVIFILTQNPIPLPDGLKEAYADYGFVIDDIKFSSDAKVFYEPILTIAIFAVLALLYPIYKTTKLNPMEAFRKT